MTEKQKDFVTNKLLLVFTLAFAVLLFVLNISNAMHSIHMATALTVTRIVAIAGVAVLILGIGMACGEKAKKRDMSLKLFRGRHIAIAGAFIAICAGALSFAFLPQMVTLLYICIPALVVLYIVWHSYPREFFFIALAAVAGGLGIWLVGSEFINRDMIVIAAVAAVIIALAVITVIAQIGKGKLGKKELFKSDAKYAIVYLSYVLVLALLAAAFLVLDMTFYFVLGIVAYIVLVGIYYTVKLI